MTTKIRHPLTEAAEQTGLAPEVIIRFVSFQWIVPSEGPAEGPGDWQQLVLDDEDIARARLIRELQQEFGVNDEAIPIILNLIDQLNRTQLELKKEH